MMVRLPTSARAAWSRAVQRCTWARVRPYAALDRLEAVVWAALTVVRRSSRAEAAHAFVASRVVLLKERHDEALRANEGVVTPPWLALERRLRVLETTPLARVAEDELDALLTALEGWRRVSSTHGAPPVDATAPLPSRVRSAPP
jgi:hypothetical protein